MNSLAKKEFQKEYVMVLRSKGMNNSTIYFKHILQNIMPALVVDFFYYFKFIIGGSLLIEAFFQLDGLGLLAFRSVLSKDEPVLMGLAIVMSFTLLISKLANDIVLLWVDPKVDFQ